MLVKVSDHLAKSGAQTAYRLSLCRQQLQVDTRPSMDSVKTFAEMLQARRRRCWWPPQPWGMGSNSMWNGAVNNATTVDVETKNVGDKHACRFWRTDQGCRRGDRCKFEHSRLNAKENRRFYCSGAGHSKKDCPRLISKKEPDTEDAKKLAKVTGKGKPSSPEKGSAETVVSSPEVPRDEKVAR